MTEPKNMDIPINQQSTGAAEIIQTGLRILHGLGRPALESWNAAGRPMPPPELATMAITHTTEV